MIKGLYFYPTSFYEIYFIKLKPDEKYWICNSIAFSGFMVL